MEVDRDSNAVQPEPEQQAGPNMGSVEDRKRIRDEVIGQLRELKAQAEKVGLNVDKNEFLGGVTQEKVWGIVKSVEEAIANIELEAQQHP